MKQNRKAAFFTLGCKLNFSETSTITRQFIEAGYEIIPFDKQADVYVINTCSVTLLAEKKCRNAINKVTKYKNSLVVVVGCYAQLQPEQLEMLEGVDIVLSNKDKTRIIEIIENNFSGISTCDFKDLQEFYPAWSIDDRTRSFLKIQDGCDYFCSYCTIPKARGLSRSDTIKNIINRTKDIVSKGIKEIVLTGVNIGDFGRKNKETLFDLLTELCKIEDLNRIRISSIEPNLLTDDIIELVAQSNTIMPHFHIPLQCGVDKLLELMHRNYTIAQFRSKIDIIRKKIPDAYIAVDVIVGVPHETEEDFNQTYHFLNSLDLSELHVFTYSERPGTIAANMEQVPMFVRRERSQKLHELSENMLNRFSLRFINSVRPVLYEKKTKNNYILGFSDNYLKVKVPNKENLNNMIVKTKLVEYDSVNNIFKGIE